MFPRVNAGPVGGDGPKYGREKKTTSGADDRCPVDTRSGHRTLMTDRRVDVIGAPQVT